MVKTAKDLHDSVIFWLTSAAIGLGDSPRMDANSSRYLYIVKQRMHSRGKQCIHPIIRVVCRR
jgi:hypothetical protein